MRFVIFSAIAALVGCNHFDYTATVGWYQAAPGIVSVSVDGDAIDQGYTLERSYESYDDSQRDAISVVVETTVDTQTFRLVATPCGGECGSGGRVCDEMTEETDDWFVIASATGGFMLDANYTSCSLDGEHIAPISRVDD